MKLQDIMSAAGLSIYAEVSLTIFFGVFLGVALDLYASRHKSRSLALLPLEDETRPRRRSEHP
ncbi:MAG TPA: hypothetical protein VMI54_12675 [Polyangiaceae bacterium]|nr:hypothetical protein [Polyangiaceae bacterium]